MQSCNDELKNIEKKYASSQSNPNDPKVTLIQNLEKELQQMTIKFENILTVSVNYKKQLQKIFSVINKELKTKFTLSDDLEHFNKEMLNLEKQCEKKLRDQTKSMQMEDRLIQLEEERPELLSTISQLKEELKSITDEQKRVHVDLEFYKGETKDLRKNNECLIEDLKLLNQNVNLETIEETNEDNILMLELELEQARQKIDKLQLQIQQSSDNVQVQTDISGDIEGQENTKAFVKNLLERIGFLDKENQRLNQEINTLNISISGLKAEITSDETEYKTTIHHLEGDNKAGKTRETSLTLQLETYKKELESSWDQRNSLEQQVAAMEGELNKLNVFLSEKDKKLAQMQEVLDGKLFFYFAKKL